jgi:hypothetical protein
MVNLTDLQARISIIKTVNGQISYFKTPFVANCDILRKPYSGSKKVGIDRTERYNKPEAF